MKLWAMPWRATQDRWVMVESSDKMWPTREGNGKPLQYSCLENPKNPMKRQKDRTLKNELPRSVGAQYAVGDQWRNNSRKTKEMEPKQKQYPLVDVTADGSKVQCCKKQYCIGTWNVRSMNQGKLEVVKQEMERVNIDILEISELKWTGMGEFNSDDHYIYYCGQETLRRNRVEIVVKKRAQNTVLGCSLKNGRMISCLFPRQTIQYHGNPRLYPDQSRWRSWSWTVLWRPTRPSRTNTQKRCPFPYRGLECKSRKSRNTYSNRQIWLWTTEWSRAKTNIVLPREPTDHSKHALPTTQEKTLHIDFTRWSTLKSDWLYPLQPKMEKLYIVSRNKTGSWLAQIMSSLLPNSGLNWRK